MATNNAVNTSLSGQTGTGMFSGSTSPSLTTPHIITSLLDINGNTIFGMSPTASAVNFITVVNQNTGNVPGIVAGSSVDSNVSFGFQTLGTGVFRFRAETTTPVMILSGTSAQHTTNLIFSDTGATRNVTFPDATGTLLMTGQAINTVPSITFSSTSGVIGTTTNDSAAAGSVGEFVTSVVAGTAATSGAATDITTISLTAGDWDVWGNIFTNPAVGTTQSRVSCGISTTSATLPTQYSIIGTPLTATVPCGQIAPNIRLSLSGTTTVYLVALVTYAVSTLTVGGTISARRRR